MKWTSTIVAVHLLTKIKIKTKQSQPHQANYYYYYYYTIMSAITSSTATTTASQSFITREQYTTAISSSIQLEKKADYYFKLGQIDQATKRYTKSLDFQRRYLGNEHPLVVEYETKIQSHNGVSSTRDWTKTSSRDGVTAIEQSLAVEKEADLLLKKGKSELALRKYNRCLDVEAKVLGSDHPMTLSLQRKIALVKSATKGNTTAAAVAAAKQPQPVTVKKQQVEDKKNTTSVLAKELFSKYRPINNVFHSSSTKKNIVLAKAA